MTIELGSLIGFALVFFVTAWVASALLGGALLLGRARLRLLGPRAERRAAAIAIVLPAALGALLALGLAGFSVLGPSFGFPDHCLDHGDHLHLCLHHGAAWSSQWWAVSLTAGLGALLAVRLARAAHAAWTTRRRLRAVRAVSSERVTPDGTIVVCSPSRQPFCFAAGLGTPRIYVGSAAFDRLDDDEQAAMLAHERAHIAFGDVWRGSALSALALFGAPGFAAASVRRWRDAGERLCDRVAADALGSPETVAAAIIAFARAPASRFGCAFVPHPAQVVDRVEALLGDAPRGDRVARRFSAAAAGALLSAAVAAAVLVDPLHHAIETLLGSH